MDLSDCSANDLALNFAGIVGLPWRQCVDLARTQDPVKTILDCLRDDVRLAELAPVVLQGMFTHHLSPDLGRINNGHW
jgi:hypothetical protein